MSFIFDILSLIDLTVYNSTGYLFLVSGILISIRFMGYPDLTVDGSFTLGAALYAITVFSGYPVVVGFLFAIFGGMLAGGLTIAINRYLSISKIISSVIVMLTLITIAPYLTHGSTVGLLNKTTWLAELYRWDMAFSNKTAPQMSSSLHLLFSTLFLAIWFIIALFLFYFFKTRVGVQMRYLGSAVKPALIKKRKQSILLLAGVALGNSLVALGGAIEAERKGGFSINMGLGVILIGLACLVLGESIIKTKVKRDELYVHEYLFSVFIGVFVYSFVLQLLLHLGLTFLDVRLTSVLFLLILLSIAARRHPNTRRLF